MALANLLVYLVFGGVFGLQSVLQHHYKPSRVTLLI
jgi:hypothetical protein